MVKIHFTQFDLRERSINHTEEFTACSFRIICINEFEPNAGAFLQQQKLLAAARSGQLWSRSIEQRVQGC